MLPQSRVPVEYQRTPFVDPIRHKDHLSKSRSPFIAREGQLFGVSPHADPIARMCTTGGQSHTGGGGNKSCTFASDGVRRATSRFQDARARLSLVAPSAKHVLLLGRAGECPSRAHRRTVGTPHSTPPYLQHVDDAEPVDLRRGTVPAFRVDAAVLPAPDSSSSCCCCLWRGRGLRGRFRFLAAGGGRGGTKKNTGIWADETDGLRGSRDEKKKRPNRNRV